MYELEKFLKENKNWEEILTGEPYYIKVKRDDSYVIFNYDQLKSDFSSTLVQQSRGIIFKESTLEPVCIPFFKFFNVGEANAAELDWSTAFVSEKIDGSLIKVWWDTEWKISTNGTIDAFKAELGDIKIPNFGKYFIETLLKYYPTCSEFFCKLDTNLTYMFELVGPYNRVVIPYEEPNIYFLGARNKYTGEEFNCSSLVADALGMGDFKLPKQYPLTSVNDCVKLAKTFSWDQEGFVACDANFNRVKIKSPAYVLAHFARNNNVINRKHLIKVILTNEVEEFLCYASDYRDELQACQRLINAYYKLGNDFVIAARKARNMSRSDFAGLVKTFPGMYHDLLFKNYNKDLSAEEYSSGWSENKWEDCLIKLEKLKNEWFNND